MMSKTNSVVAVFEAHGLAENAIRELQRHGFNMENVSIIARGFHDKEQVVGYYTTGDRMKHWGTLGAFWGGLWGLLCGSLFFWVPGIGPLIAAGPVAAWIIGALEDGVATAGLGVLSAALFSLGIPKDSVLKYESDVRNGRFLLVAHGTLEEVQNAKDILNQTRALTTTIHAEKTAISAS